MKSGKTKGLYLVDINTENKGQLVHCLGFRLVCDLQRFSRDWLVLIWVNSRVLVSFFFLHLFIFISVNLEINLFNAFLSFFLIFLLLCPPPSFVYIRLHSLYQFMVVIIVGGFCYLEMFPLSFSWKHLRIQKFLV